MFKLEQHLLIFCFFFTIALSQQVSWETLANKKPFVITGTPEGGQLYFAYTATIDEESVGLPASLFFRITTNLSVTNLTLTLRTCNPTSGGLITKTEPITRTTTSNSSLYMAPCNANGDLYKFGQVYYLQVSNVPTNFTLTVTDEVIPVTNVNLNVPDGRALYSIQVFSFAATGTTSQNQQVPSSYALLRYQNENPNNFSGVWISKNNTAASGAFIGSSKSASFVCAAATSPIIELVRCPNDSNTRYLFLSSTTPMTYNLDFTSNNATAPNTTVVVPTNQTIAYSFNSTRPVSVWRVDLDGGNFSSINGLPTECKTVYRYQNGSSTGGPCNTSFTTNSSSLQFYPCDVGSVFVAIECQSRTGEFALSFNTSTADPTTSLFVETQFGVNHINENETYWWYIENATALPDGLPDVVVNFRVDDVGSLFIVRGDLAVFTMPVGTSCPPAAVQVASFAFNDTISAGGWFPCQSSQSSTGKLFFYFDTAGAAEFNFSITAQPYVNITPNASLASTVDSGLFGYLPLVPSGWQDNDLAVVEETLSQLGTGYFLWNTETCNAFSPDGSTDTTGAFWIFCGYDIRRNVKLDDYLMVYASYDDTPTQYNITTINYGNPGQRRFIWDVSENITAPTLPAGFPYFTLQFANNRTPFNITVFSDQTGSGSVTFALFDGCNWLSTNDPASPSFYSCNFSASDHCSFAFSLRTQDTLQILATTTNDGTFTFVYTSTSPLTGLSAAPAPTCVPATDLLFCRNQDVWFEPSDNLAELDANASALSASLLNYFNSNETGSKCKMFLTRYACLTTVGSCNFHPSDHCELCADISSACGSSQCFQDICTADFPACPVEEPLSAPISYIVLNTTDGTRFNITNAKAGQDLYFSYTALVDEATIGQPASLFFQITSSLKVTNLTLSIIECLPDGPLLTITEPSNAVPFGVYLAPCHPGVDLYVFNRRYFLKVTNPPANFTIHVFDQAVPVTSLASNTGDENGVNVQIKLFTTAPSHGRGQGFDLPTAYEVFSYSKSDSDALWVTRSDPDFFGWAVSISDTAENVCGNVVLSPNPWGVVQTFIEAASCDTLEGSSRFVYIAAGAEDHPQNVAVNFLGDVTMSPTTVTNQTEFTFENASRPILFLHFEAIPDFYDVYEFEFDPSVTCTITYGFNGTNPVNDTNATVPTNGTTIAPAGNFGFNKTCAPPSVQTVLGNGTIWISPNCQFDEDIFFTIICDYAVPLSADDTSNVRITRSTQETPQPEFTGFDVTNLNTTVAFWALYNTSEFPDGPNQRVVNVVWEAYSAGTATVTLSRGQFYYTAIVNCEGPAPLVFLESVRENVSRPQLQSWWPCHSQTTQNDSLLYLYIDHPGPYDFTVEIGEYQNISVNGSIKGTIDGLQVVPFTAALPDDPAPLTIISSKSSYGGHFGSWDDRTCSDTTSSLIKLFDGKLEESVVSFCADSTTLMYFQQLPPNGHIFGSSYQITTTSYSSPGPVRFAWNTSNSSNFTVFAVVAEAQARTIEFNNTEEPFTILVESSVAPAKVVVKLYDGCQLVETRHCIYETLDDTCVFVPVNATADKVRLLLYQPTADSVDSNFTFTYANVTCTTINATRNLFCGTTMNPGALYMDPVELNRRAERIYNKTVAFFNPGALNSSGCVDLLRQYACDQTVLPCGANFSITDYIQDRCGLCEKVTQQCGGNNCFETACKEFFSCSLESDASSIVGSFISLVVLISLLWI